MARCPGAVWCAYAVALRADADLSAELQRQFGAAAGDRRYDRRRRGWDAATLAADARRSAAVEAWWQAV